MTTLGQRDERPPSASAQALNRHRSRLGTDGALHPGMTIESSDLKVAVSEHDHVRGFRRALVTLVEYGDFDCHFCAAAYVQVRTLLRRLPEYVRLVFRHNPRGELHPNAHLGAQAAEAAALQGQFWSMHDALFEREGTLTEAFVTRCAASQGLDLDRFAADLHSTAVSRRIREDQIGGLRSGVIGTPTFFVNGVHFRDKPDLKGLSQAILATLPNDQSRDDGPFSSMN